MTDQRNNRILVIDDNPAIHQDFRKILAGAAGSDREVDALLEEFLGAEAEPAGRAVPTIDIAFEISDAHQGEEALGMVEQARSAGKPFALAFVDVRMPPGWDGIRTLAELWKVDPKLQAVICTAYSDYSYGEMLAKLGQSDRLLILKKPFDPIEVQQLASALVEKWNVTRAAEQSLDEVRAYAASLETVNRALISGRSMNENLGRAKTDFVIDAGRAMQAKAGRISSAVEQAARLTGATSEIGELVPDAASMVNLIEQVIELADEDGRLHVSPEPCNLAETIAKLSTEFSTEAAASGKHYAFTGDLQSLPREARLDAGRLESLLRHLLAGCRDLDPEGQVEFSAHEQRTGGFGQPWLAFGLHVPGLALEHDQRTSLFEPFSTGSDSLHLPIARQLARFLGAELTFEDSEDVGTTIRVRMQPSRGERREAA